MLWSHWYAENVTAPMVAKYEVTYVTTHKGPALTTTFSNDGKLAATGSADSSIKVLDVEAMMTKTALGHQQDLHPVIRTLYDHSDVRVCVYMLMPSNVEYLNATVIHCTDVNF